jgi:hypothetical protein
MNIQSLAAAALAATSLSAFAVGPGPLGAIDNLPLTVSNVVAQGIFQDVYSFTLVGPGMLSGSAVAINSSVGATSYNILGLTVTLQDASFALVGSDNTPATGFTFNNLAAGTYALNVLGYANGSEGGSYAGDVLATTAPVPEPQAYALMLAGLAAVGFAASRRQPKA